MLPLHAGKTWHCVTVLLIFAGSILCQDANRDSNVTAFKIIRCSFGYRNKTDVNSTLNSTNVTDESDSKNGQDDGSFRILTSGEIHRKRIIVSCFDGVSFSFVTSRQKPLNCS